MPDVGDEPTTSENMIAIFYAITIVLLVTHTSYWIIKATLSKRYTVILVLKKMSKLQSVPFTLCSLHNPVRSMCDRQHNAYGIGHVNHVFRPSGFVSHIGHCPF